MSTRTHPSRNGRRLCPRHDGYYMRKQRTDRRRVGHPISITTALVQADRTVLLPGDGARNEPCSLSGPGRSQAGTSHSPFRSRTAAHGVIIIATRIAGLGAADAMLSTPATCEFSGCSLDPTTETAASIVRMKSSAPRGCPRPPVRERSLAGRLSVDPCHHLTIFVLAIFVGSRRLERHLRCTRALSGPTPSVGRPCRRHPGADPRPRDRMFGRNPRLHSVDNTFGGFMVTHRMLEISRGGSGQERGGPAINAIPPTNRESSISLQAPLILCPEGSTASVGEKSLRHDGMPSPWHYARHDPAVD